MEPGADIDRGAEFAAVIGRALRELVDGGETGCDAARRRFSLLELPGRDHLVADVEWISPRAATIGSVRSRTKRLSRR